MMKWFGKPDENRLAKLLFVSVLFVLHISICHSVSAIEWEPDSVNWLNVKQGTMHFWVKPYHSTESTDKSRPVRLLSVAVKQGTRFDLLYKPQYASLSVVSEVENRRNLDLGSGKKTRMHVGQWNYVVLTWGQELKFYINGKLAGSEKRHGLFDAAIDGHPTIRCLVLPDKGKNIEQGYALDEFTVWDAVLEIESLTDKNIKRQEPVFQESFENVATGNLEKIDRSQRLQVTGIKGKALFLGDPAAQQFTSDKTNQISTHLPENVVAEKKQIELIPMYLSKQCIVARLDESTDPISSELEYQWFNSQNQLIQNEVLPSMAPALEDGSVLKTDKLNPGQYYVQIINGSQTLKREFVIPKMPEWQGTDAGIQGTQVVLNPWTPLIIDSQVNRLTSTCWNRSIVIQNDDQSLVKQIENGGCNLLILPIMLTAIDAKGRTLEASGSWQVKQKSETRLQIVRDYSVESTKLTVQITHCYDGMLDIVLRGVDPKKFKEVTVKLALDAQYVPLMYHVPPPYRSFDNVRKINKDQNYLDREGKLLLYLGSYERGLFYRSDNPADYSYPVSVTKAGGKVDVKVDLLESGSDVRDLTRSFILIPTPVRPIKDINIALPGRWFFPFANSKIYWEEQTKQQIKEGYEKRKLDLMYELDLNREKGYDTVVVGPNWTTSWGGMLPKDGEIFKDFLNEVHKRDMKAIVYVGYESDDALNDFKEFAFEMLGEYPEGRKPKTHARFAEDRKAYGAWRAGPEMDRRLAGMKELLENYEVDGFFFDGSQLPTAPGHPMLQTLGYRPTLRMREFLQRVRYLLDQYRPGQGMMFAHSSSRLNIFVNGLMDGLYNGENLGYGTELKGNMTDLFKLLPFEYPALLYSFQTWGLPIYFINDIRDRRQFDAEKIALFLKAGTQSRLELYNSTFAKNAKYIPFWNLEKKWPDRPDSLHMSAYQGSHGYVCSLINLSDDSKNCMIPLSEMLDIANQKNGFSPIMIGRWDNRERWPRFSLTDMEKQQHWKIINGNLVGKIGPNALMFIELLPN
jgi:hypothetical protein